MKEKFNLNIQRRKERIERDITTLNLMLKQHKYKTQFKLKDI